MHSRIGRASLALGIAVLLAACGGQGSVDAKLGAAEDLLKQRKYADAKIQLKSVLQEHASSPRARLLLGSALLEAGETVDAETELRKAKELGASDRDVQPLLARALLANGQHRKLLADYLQLDFGTGPEAVAAAADLNVTLAKAYLRAGSIEKARERADAAALAAPDFLPARLLQIRLLDRSIGVDAALERLRALGPKKQSSAEAEHLEGMLLLNGKKDVDAAIAALRRALDIEPDHVPSHAELIAVYLYKDDMPAARKQLESLKKALPNSVAARIYDAQLALIDGDYARARSQSQAVLKVQPENVRTLYIAGATELKLKNSFQAIAHLGKVVALTPEFADARRLLAAAYLSAGQAAQATKTLERLLRPGSTDFNALALAAEASLQQGDAVKADALYKRALALRPDDPQLRTAVAVSSIQQGDADGGIQRLEKLVSEDGGSAADLALISGYLRQGRLEQAFKRAVELERKRPDQVEPLFLQGRIQILQNNLKGARSTFERVLSKDASSFAAVNSLALLDVMEGRPTDAKKRLLALAQGNSKSQAALLSVADLLALQGAPVEDVAAVIRDAIKIDPQELGSHIMLGEYLLGKGETKPALEAAQRAVAIAPESVPAVELLGRTLLAVGDDAQALKVFGRLGQLQPGSVTPHLRLAETYRRLNDSLSAEKSLKAALLLNPAFLPAQEQLIGVAVQTGRQQEALSISKTVQKQRPAETIGYVLEGDIYLQARKWDQALAAFRQGVDKLVRTGADVGPLAAKIHATLTASKRLVEAQAFAADWLKAHPKDVETRAYLADLALMNGEFVKAEPLYKQVLELAPSHMFALNNTAWMLAKQNKPGAVAMAQQAIAASPQSPEPVDTLAFALAQEKQLDKAVETAKRAVSMAPNHGRYRLNLAKLYLKAGQKGEAKSELTRLREMGASFPNQAEVADLLGKV